ncbi:MAG: cytochrome d ubiquinol oxidase subunit II [Oligoflexia bacterium]|nr:cytochrome d ubiquinol oxidase subunit II [Oligoflexia bacterium]MBF0364228.1 cytochrome d ubiquinol oxidase subunit II [Oligoflexia bacterium]
MEQLDTTFLALQVIWFCIIAILFVGYFLLDGFDLGVSSCHLFTADPKERKVFLKSIGPVWDGNEVWLLTAGGALFAAFPSAYATIFSGLYWPFLLILFGLIFRGVGIEFRNKMELSYPNYDTWINRFDMAFAVGGVFTMFMIGVAIGNIVTGMSLSAKGDSIGSLLSLFSAYPLLAGVTTVCVLTTYGALYLIHKVPLGNSPSAVVSLYDRSFMWAEKSWWLSFITVALVAVVAIIFYRRDHPLLPLVTIATTVVGLMLLTMYHIKKRDASMSFISWILTIVSIACFAVALLFPNFVPIAIGGSGEAITLFNASSSKRTLIVMLIITLLTFPVVLGYTYWIYKIFKGRVTAEN